MVSFPFKQLRENKSLSDQVLDNIKEAIIRGDLKEGSRLRETHLAQAIGISRTPVREAMFRLEKEGLLSRLPRGGYVVASLSEQEIEETFGIRSVLESYAARLATIRYRDNELQPLREQVEKFERYLKRGDTEKLLEINTQFHDLLYSLSRSPKLIRMINELKDQIYRLRRMILKEVELAKISNKDHREMLRAMEDREPDRVERLVREHILRGKQVILQNIKKLSKERG